MDGWRAQFEGFRTLRRHNLRKSIRDFYYQLRNEVVEPLRLRLFDGIGNGHTYSKEEVLAVVDAFAMFQKHVQEHAVDPAVARPLVENPWHRVQPQRWNEPGTSRNLYDPAGDVSRELEEGEAELKQLVEREQRIY